MALDSHRTFNRTVLGACISRDRTMLIAEAFLRTLVKVYGKHPVYTDEGTWYPQTCNFLGLVHRLHSPFEKSIIERTIRYFKDRTEGFDDYYPCLRGNSCTLLHVHNWIKLFISIYTIMNRLSHAFSCIDGSFYQTLGNDYFYTQKQLMIIVEYCMYPNYNTNMKLVIIVLTLISSISLGLSLNAAPNSLNFNNFAFAQQNPVLPNYRGDQQAFEPSKMLDNRTNLASNEIQPKSIVHYQPIIPAASHYTGNSIQPSMNSYPISTTTNMINSTNTSSIVQPVSSLSTHYQPITPTASSDHPTNNKENSNTVHHASSGTEDDNNGNYHDTSSSGDHHGSNNEQYFGWNHSHDFHSKPSSKHYNDDTGNEVNNNNNNSNDHNSNDHNSSHHHGDQKGNDEIIITSSDDYQIYGNGDHESDYHDEYGYDSEEDQGISIASDSGAFASAG
jgi:hypothetical protein